MIDISGYSEVEVKGDYASLTAGGYVCKIIHSDIVKVNDRPQLQLCIDIAEGDFKDFFHQKLTRKLEQGKDAEWDFNAVFKRYIFENGKVSGRFKEVIEAIRHSNKDFVLNEKRFDEKSIEGKLCGFTFGLKEVRNKINGEIFNVVKIAFPMSVDRIRAGNFRIPKPELLKDRADTTDDSGFSGETISEDNMPF